MILIIGGAYQGKRDFLKRRFPEAEHVVLSYQDEIGRNLRQGLDPVEEFMALFRKQPDMILTADLVGMGIVPIDKEEEEYREAVGRTLQIAAQCAKEVWNVVCGLGERIK